MFRERAELSHVMATFTLQGRHGERSSLLFQLANSQEWAVATLRIEVPSTEDPFQCFQCITPWALYDALLPAYYVLSRALRWPSSCVTPEEWLGMFCPELDTYNFSNRWDNSLGCNLFAIPGANFHLRLAPQSPSRMDLAWVDATRMGDPTFMIMEFSFGEHFPINEERVSLHSIVLMLGTCVSAMLGRDIQRQDCQDDARRPITPDPPICGWTPLLPPPLSNNSLS